MIELKCVIMSTRRGFKVLEVLFEDKNLIACVKPVGVASQGSESGRLDMTELIRRHLADNGGKGEPYVVHRLDSGVGGVMVYAKNSKTAAHLSRLISESSACDSTAEKSGFAKEYLAVTLGVPEKPEGYLEDLLYHDRQRNKTFVVDRKRNGVKRALLWYEVLDTCEFEGKKLSLVRVKLFTGRTHQVRVQFASRTTPLFADARYGAKGTSGDIVLWSHKITVSFPDGSTKTFEKSPPAALPWSLFENQF